MDGAVLFDHDENEVLGFNSIIRSNVSVGNGVSFSETLITDVVGGTNGSRMFDIVDGGCEGKVGKFSCWLVKNEDKAKNVAMANFCAVVEHDSVLKSADNFVVTKNDTEDSRVSDVATYQLKDGFDLVGDLNNKNTQEDSVPRESVFSDVNYRVSDLVWGKVRGHLWWPGQIYDPSVALEKAKRHRKENCYLIAYFGDQTFSWNDVSMIKPFHTHFSEMEKQSNLKKFRHAVDFALEEASRRVEFGLSCPCIPREASLKLKTQVIANATTSFEPMDLVNFVKTLAQSSLTEFNRLEFVSAHAQLSAFYRSKGNSQLPEFAMLGRLYENDMEILPVREKQQCDDQINEQVLMKTYDGFSQKSQQISQNKKKLLSDLMSEKTTWTLKGECTPEKKAGDYSISRRGRERKAAHDSTYKYFHHSQIPDDKSTSKRGRKRKAAYENYQIANDSVFLEHGGETGVVTSTEAAALSSLSTAIPVELIYDSYWTDRIFLI